jgi:hypothetical protein
MTQGSKTKDYASRKLIAAEGSIFHRNVDWGHANLELQVFTMQLLMSSVFILSEQQWGENSRG